MTTAEAPACALLPSASGLICSLQAGHPGACAAVQDKVAQWRNAGDDIDAAVTTLGGGTQESGPAPARRYGIRRLHEVDLDLPSGDLVRIRKLNMNHLFQLRITELRDVFTADLLADGEEGNVDEEAAQKGLEEVLLDPERGARFLEPINRVVVAAVVCPKVVAEGESDDEQVYVGDIDIVDKIVIFTAAIGEQLAAFGGQQEALKSVQPGPQAGA